MGPTRSLDALDASEPFDVCIVGSGFAGTILGRSLAARGVRTLILESGGGLMRWFVDARVQELAAYVVSGDADYPSTRTKARALGGNSNFWTGRCERFHPSDLAPHAYTPANNPWPIGYQELEPYYELAEATLAVRGNGVSRYAPPRRAGFPVASHTQVSSLQSLLEPAAVVVDESPTATPRRAWRFFRVQKELLSGFCHLPTVVVLTDATVTRLVSDHQRRVVGAEVRSLDGARKTARARVYVAACGGIETPRLLLLSRSEVFPNGIGNAHDRVGRGFTEHPGINMSGRIRHNRHTVLPRHKLGRTHQFYDQFRPNGLGSVLPVFIQSWVFPNHLVQPRVRDVPRALRELVQRTLRPTIYAGATIEMLPYDGNRITLAEQRRDRFGNALAHLHFGLSEEDRRTLAATRSLLRDILVRIGADGLRETGLTWSRHHIGACRMGDNPATSVTNRDLRIHECENLYVCGSETFVTGGAVPPVLTIAALAHRLADHLTAVLGRR